MTTSLTNRSYFQKHLYFEDYPSSREYALDKCNKVLEMIAKLQDRNYCIIRDCRNWYGVDYNGHVKMPHSDIKKYKSNLATINRLKSYYNYCLSQLKGFQNLNVPND